VEGWSGEGWSDGGMEGWSVHRRNLHQPLLDLT
jgi:hypothetical protein